MAKLDCLCLDRAAGSVTGKLFECDADGERTHPGRASVEDNGIVELAARGGCLGKNPLQAAQEVVAITISLKTQQVILQQGPQDGLSPGQFLENIRRRKWNVQEETRMRRTARFSEITA